MKYSDVAAAHRAEEAPIPKASTRDPLHLRLYFKEHLTELVRAFGYESVPLAEARERLAKLRERYGQKIIEEAAEELLDVQSESNTQFACLKENVRKIATPLLGRPPTNASPPPVAADAVESENPTKSLDDDIDGEMDLHDDEPEDDLDDKTSEESPISGDSPATGDRTSTEIAAKSATNCTSLLIPHDSPDAPGKPVRRAVKEVKTGFASWVADIGKNAEPLGSERLNEFSPHTRTVPDYILHFGESLALVIIRRSLSKTQRHDMQEWQRVFGNHHAVLRIWPIKDKLQWIWTAETVIAAVEPTAHELALNSQTVSDPGGETESPCGPAPHKATDYSHVSHRLDLLAEEMDGFDELLRQAGETQRQLRADLDAVRDQLQRVLPES